MATALQSAPRIIVVEDEYLLASDLAYAFSLAGAEVVGIAGTVAGALRMIEDYRDLDGAALDMNLQGSIAGPVADALLARGIPFVITTGYDRRQLGREYKHVRRFEKPFTASKVVAALLEQCAPPPDGH
jgi:CheY-like chemotaxis protein